jgi:hypothetical protein
MADSSKSQPEQTNAPWHIDLLVLAWSKSNDKPLSNLSPIKERLWFRLVEIANRAVGQWWIAFAAARQNFDHHAAFWILETRLTMLCASLSVFRLSDENCVSVSGGLRH